MSIPRINITGTTYSPTNKIASFEMYAIGLRGCTGISLSGFSASHYISASNGYYNTVDAVGSTSTSALTYSVDLNTSTYSYGTNSTYVPATMAIAFTSSSGNANNGDNIKIKPVYNSSSVFSRGVVGYTFSGTTSLSNGLNLMVASMSFTGVYNGFSATVSGYNIIFSSNWGTYYNGYTASFSSNGSSTGITFSSASYTFSGGSTTLKYAAQDTSGIFGILGTSSLTV